MIFEPGTWTTAEVPATGKHVVQFFDVEDFDARIFRAKEPYTINFVQVDWLNGEPLVTDMGIMELPMTLLFVDGVEQARAYQLGRRIAIEEWLLEVDPS